MTQKTGNPEDLIHYGETDPTRQTRAPEDGYREPAAPVDTVFQESKNLLIVELMDKYHVSPGILTTLLKNDKLVKPS